MLDKRHAQWRGRNEASRFDGQSSCAISFVSADGINFYRKEEICLPSKSRYFVNTLLSGIKGVELLEIKNLIIVCLKFGSPFRIVAPYVVNDLVEEIVEISGRRLMINGKPHIMLGFDLAPKAKFPKDTRSRIVTKFSKVLDSIPCGIAIFDDKGELVYFNTPYVEALSRMNLTPKLGNSLYVHLLRLRHMATVDTDRQAEEVYTCQIDRAHWIKAYNVRSQDDYHIITIFDVSDLKLAEQKLKWQAEVDPLTGLLNRKAFFAQLQNISHNKRKDDSGWGCIILLDIDHFKTINDTYGHHFGDLVLSELAKRIRNRIRRTDLAARLGGDEFIIYLHNICPEEQERLIDALHAKLTARMTILDKSLEPGVSMGVVTLKAPYPTEDDIYHRADVALYKAKHAGRNVWRNFDPELERRSERRKYLLEALREDLARGAIDIALQPQIQLPDKKHVGFEVLARWHHKGEYIPPVEFIDIAERHGLIHLLGLQIMKKAARWYAHIQSAGLCPGRLAINISVLQLKDPRFVEQAIKALGSSGLHPSDIEIEVTETALIERGLEIIEEHLNRLSHHGFRISLDDFGTGNATFSHLKRFPIHVLKIDRTFIDDIGRNSENTAIVKAIISIAETLNMEVIAEGVENENQEDFLLRHGCQIVQGYRYARPLCPDDAVKWLMRNDRA